MRRNPNEKGENVANDHTWGKRTERGLELLYKREQLQKKWTPKPVIKGKKKQGEPPQETSEMPRGTSLSKGGSNAFEREA